MLGATQRRGRTKMIYLWSTQIAVDAQSLGFPSVDSCLAVVLQSDQGLAGWHSFNTNLATTGQNAAQFGAYATANLPGVWLRLYGACNRGVRGGNWQQDMQAIATAIGFTGTVIGLDMKVTTGGAHVEFHRNNGSGRCDVYHKRSSKIVYEKNKLLVGSLPHRIVDRRAPTYQQIRGGQGYAEMFTGARVDTTTSKSGKMNHAGWFDLQSFTV